MTDPPVPCVGFDEDLSALLDGELAPARQGEVRAHVAGCARCSDRLARLARVDEALRSLRHAEVPTDLAERLRARIAEEARGRSSVVHERGRSSVAHEPGRTSDAPAAAPARPAPPRRRRWIPFAATAFAAAAALALYLVVARPRPASQEPTIAEREEPAPEQEVAKRETPPATGPPRAEQLEPGGEPAAIEAASDEDIAVALDLETLADLEVIERLDVLEDLAALDGAG